ncbi:hypothetical protein F66182_8417 [Fusarium sp. NRRL 66182]|nr:hypothetical protein F66182_8417 [Fusarium sp. NRRL 66182]
MPLVIETAFLQLKVGYDTQKVRDLVKKSQQVQAQWIRKHQPELLEGKPYHHTTDFWFSEDELPCLFLAAPWESVKAHKDWIKSRENTSTMLELQEVMSQDEDAVFLCHLNPAGDEVDLRGDLLAKGPIKVWRISVKPEERTLVEKEYRNIEALSSAGPGQGMWAGWRIEKVKDAEEMIIIASPSMEDAVESNIAVKFVDAKVFRFQYQPFVY